LLLQAAEGLRYLHEFNPTVVHGDVRGPNVLVSASGDVCIADFGLSYTLEEDKVSYSTTWKNAGNPAWMAPELLGEDPLPRSISSDVFSFGRMMLELTTGKQPFHYLPRLAIYLPASKGEMPKRPENTTSTKWLTDDVWALAEDCCHPRFDYRPQMYVVVTRLRELRLYRGATKNTRITSTNIFESPTSRALDLDEEAKQIQAANEVERTPRSFSNNTDTESFADFKSCVASRQKSISSSVLPSPSYSQQYDPLEAGSWHGNYF